jgi:hypothetical protein
VVQNIDRREVGKGADKKEGEGREDQVAGMQWRRRRRSEKSQKTKKTKKAKRKMKQQQKMRQQRRGVGVGEGRRGRVHRGARRRGGEGW